MADYGRTLSLVDGFAPHFPQVEGGLVVLEAIVRRWTTAPESLAGRRIYQSRCRDVRALLAARLSSDRLASVGADLAQIARSDPRVQDALALVTMSAPDKRMFIRGVLQLAEGPFPLVLAVTGVTVEVLSDGV